MKNQSGSFTVEAALVMSAVIIVLSLLILSFTVMYQKVLITKTAIKTAREGANHWADGNQSLYYRISESLLLAEEEKSLTFKQEGSVKKEGPHDNNGPVGGKLSQIQASAAEELSREIVKPLRTEIVVTFGNLLGFREIVVELAQEMRMPLGVLTALVNGKDALTLHSTGKSVIVEPADYIRNVDLFLELTSKYDSISKGLSILKNKAE